jgi:S-adenosylmethionine hydrolase
MAPAHENRFRFMLRPRKMREHLSGVFHGCDVFAKTADANDPG